MYILHHTNIVELFAVISEPGHYGIVMEYVLHGALDDYILDNNVRFFQFLALGTCTVHLFFVWLWLLHTGCCAYFLADVNISFNSNLEMFYTI